MTEVNKEQARELPQLRLHFQPQEWQNDYAVNIDGAREFDATHAILDLPLEEIRRLKTNSYESDDLVPDEVMNGHSGPYYVSVDWKIGEFFQNLGYNIDEMTEEQLELVRAIYADDRAKENAKWKGSGI